MKGRFPLLESNEKYAVVLMQIPRIYLLGQCTFKVIKMQMKPIREQRIYDNTLYFKLCT